MTENDYDAFIKRLQTNYPVMFANSYGGVCTGPGWWPILENLCANIDSYTNWHNSMAEKYPSEYEAFAPVTVAQIKEKFGGLRFYYDGGDAKIDGMVRMAESWAENACEECGKPGRRRAGGWVKTLCDEHEAERQERMNARFKTVDQS